MLCRCFWYTLKFEPTAVSFFPSLATCQGLSYSQMTPHGHREYGRKKKDLDTSDIPASAIDFPTWWWQWAKLVCSGSPVSISMSHSKLTRISSSPARLMMSCTSEGKPNLWICFGTDTPPSLPSASVMFQKAEPSSVRVPGWGTLTLNTYLAWVRYIQTCFKPLRFWH
jgi:hypothetical protein